MAVKKRSTVSKTVVNLLLLLPSLLSLFSNLTSLIKIQAGVAGKRLIVLIVLAVAIAFLLLSSWLCLLALLFIYLTSLQLSMVMCVSIIFIANTILLFIVSLAALRVKNNLLHPLNNQ
jgi:hypothetical protein